jgi:glycosyl transferase family 87
VASLLAFALSTIASLRALGWRLPLLGWLALVVFLLAWGPAAAFSLTFQLSFLLMAPVTAAWLAARAGRSTAAGAWLGLAATAKPFLLLVVAFLAIRRDRRALQAFAVVSLAFVLAGAVVFGPGAYRDWLLQLRHVTWGGHYMNASLGGLLERLLGRGAYAGFGAHAWLKGGLLAAGSAVMITLTLRHTARMANHAAGIDRAWGALLLASILLSPLGWVYYVWIALWPVAAAIGRARPWRGVSPRDGWLVPGLLGWLWFRRMASWGQPHVLATVAFASMYFWALLALWWWCLDRGPRSGGRAAETV